MLVQVPAARGSSQVFRLSAGLFVCSVAILSSLMACRGDGPSEPNTGGRTGGAAAGGSATGGKATGGTATGGATGGGGSTGTGGGTGGGTATGGAATGGGGAGGSATGGNRTGGSGTGGSAPGGAGTGGSAAGGAGGHVGFYVDGRTLRDKCGEKVVLRGINEMVIYTPSQDGTPYLAEMAMTGANSVRITWNTTGPVDKLDAVMKNTIAAHMIPMVVLNDATGDLSKLPAEVDYWVRTDVVAALKKYEDKLLVNIGNEVGDSNVTQAAFTSAYTTAIMRMRTAGIHTPLVIDGSSYGQDIDMLQATGPGLLAGDPDHNLVFSVHMYWNDPNGTRVMSEISQSVAANLPLIVGEFAQHAVYLCSQSPFAYKVLMSVAKTSEIGYLPWSWGGVTNNDCKADQPFDMSTDGTFAKLQGWGKEVAVTDPNSIMATSVRSHYMTAGSCL